MVSEDGTEVTVEGAVEDQEVEKDEDGQEVIKVYIFKADSGEDDMGEFHSDQCLPLSVCGSKQDLQSLKQRILPFKGCICLPNNQISLCCIFQLCHSATAGQQQTFCSCF